ncbi:MAG: DUF302 domain-containing protein [Gemmatimonadota bacterium]|nr:DUF302 domain-containing protein [Gemmatimonadota bacterium]MDH3427285.1 DUF302 domain-containing protein [Gemmatimonadota bacterium]
MKDMSHDVRLNCAHEEAIDRVTDALAAEGFGVLSRIDIDKKFREKLGVDFRPYTILGACNPALANLALGAAPEIGLLLPCNVTVEQLDGAALVRIINARTMMDTAGYGDDEQIAPVGREADERLKRVAAALAS